MKKEFIRQVVVFEDHFKEFRKTLSKETLKKLYQILTLIMMVEVIPVKFLRAIEGRKGLYEIRVEQGSDIYRVFCCFDEGNLVILFNGFQKKTQKTPPEQLDKAEMLMKKYFEQKTTSKQMKNKNEPPKMNLTPVEALIAEDFGEMGTPERNQFEMECDAFIIGEQLKAERTKAGLTQEQLADKIGTKKSFISRVERGHTDIQLSTLVKLFQGLGRQISVRVL